MRTIHRRACTSGLQGLGHGQPQRIGLLQGGDAGALFHAHQGIFAFGIAPGGTQAQLRAIQRGKGRQRHRAAATHATADCPLGSDTQPRGHIHQGLQSGVQIVALAADFNAQGALAGGRQHLLWLEDMANALLQAQALEARSGQYDGVVLPLVELAQARVQIAAQRHDLQIRAQVLQQHLAAQAGGTHHRALGQILQARIARRDKGIARVFALHHAGQGEALGQLHGHVLERVHGDMGAAFFQGHFQFLDEQALAAHLGEGAIQDLVALGGHAQQLHLQPLGAQQCLDVVGLPQGQTAFAGGDDEFRVFQNGVHRVHAQAPLRACRGC